MIIHTCDEKYVASLFTFENAIKVGKRKRLKSRE
jgi:hypothetical protein